MTTEENLTELKKMKIGRLLDIMTAVAEQTMSAVELDKIVSQFWSDVALMRHMR